MVAKAERMSRGDSVSRMHGAPKSRRGVQFLKNCYAPTAYKCIVTNHCYYQALTVFARVGTGNSL